VVIDTARFDGLSVREGEKVVIDTALLTHGLSDEAVIDTAHGHFDGLSVREIEKAVIDTARFDGLSVREVEKVVIDTAFLTYGLSDEAVIDTARGHFVRLSV
jgi:hypothetical protein